MLAALMEAVKTHSFRPNRPRAVRHRQGMPPPSGLPRREGCAAEV